MRNGLIAFIALAWLVGLGAACGDDSDDGFVGPYGPFVGGPCIDTLDCVSGSFCVEGGDFPDGMCTTPCNGHNDCPRGTACIDAERGICALYCFEDRDCREGYHCKERNDQGDDDKSLICIK